MGNRPGTHLGCVAAVTTLIAVGAAVVVFSPVGALALTGVALGATLGPPACIAAGVLYDWRKDKRKAAERAAEEAASQAARRRAEERARQEEARRQAEERARQARRRAAERARQEARRQAEERARQEARRQAQERARQEEARRLANERARQEEARRLAEQRARQEEERCLAEQTARLVRRRAEERAIRAEALRVALERARQEEARRQAEERARQEEARRQAEERTRQEEARRQAEQRARQEASERCNVLINEGERLYREGWQAENDCNPKLAKVKFQKSYAKFTEACVANPSDAKSVKWREICRLKIRGNSLFNEGIKFQERGFNKEALDSLKEAKQAFVMAFAKSNDTGFQECIAIVEESVVATVEALHEANEGQARQRESEIRTEQRDGSQFIRVVDHFTSR